MITILAEDVNDAYVQGVRLALTSGVMETSRAGCVVVVPEPVVTTTTNPTHRVLLDRKRRANPFFHLFESLWMLQGDRNARWLDQFVSDFSERFAEEDGAQWGAYGYRWRSHFGRDQIETCVRLLRNDNTDRRVVITMWDPSVDLDAAKFTKSGEPPKDVPCNTHIYPRIHNNRLSLTVCCRSNDLYWGAHGANAVHFSFLLEYMAGRIGVQPGALHQVSNNYHGYVSVLPEKMPLHGSGCYERLGVSAMPIMTRPEDWDRDLDLFMGNPLCDPKVFENEWFWKVAQPMWRANLDRLARDRASFDVSTREIRATDWQMAVRMWRPE